VLANQGAQLKPRLSACFLCHVVACAQNSVAADTLLYFCKRLWGLPYLAPTFALLLHRCARSCGRQQQQRRLQEWQQQQQQRGQQR
jgi:hypothetical protein